MSEDSIRADNERLRKEVEALTKERDFALGRMNNQFNLRNELRSEFDKLTKEKDQAVAACDNLARELVAHREKAHGNYWAWQGKSEDNLESLVCPVLISAKQLKEIVDPLHEARWIIEFIKRAESHETTETEQEEFLKRLDKWNEAAKKVGVE